MEIQLVWAGGMCEGAGTFTLSGVIWLIFNMPSCIFPLLALMLKGHLPTHPPPLSPLPSHCLLRWQVCGRRL